jgi:glyoxylase-like metal-dependent hydrolase (beta-lactamase superfamily II)
LAQPATAAESASFRLQPRAGVSRLADDLVCLSCPVPFDVGFVNTYLLIGEPLTLVDTGSRLGFTIDDLEALMSRAGHRLADLRQVVLTHRHIDHFGLAHEVKQRSGATVVSSRVDGPLMARWEESAREWRGDLKRHGAAFGIPEHLFEANEQTWRFIAASAVSVESDRLVGEGDLVEAGGRRLRVIEAPGHTEGLITLFDDADGTYLANDHVLRHITPNPDVYDYDPENLRSGLPDYVDSLLKVRDLPARVVYPGHGHEMTDLAGRVDEILRHHDDRAAKVLGFLGQAPATVFGLVERVWPAIKPNDTHLAVREIIGHVVLLERDGLLRRERDGERLVFSAR